MQYKPRNIEIKTTTRLAMLDSFQFRGDEWNKYLKDLRESVSYPPATFEILQRIIGDWRKTITSARSQLTKKIIKNT